MSRFHYNLDVAAFVDESIFELPSIDPFNDRERLLSVKKWMTFSEFISQDEFEGIGVHFYEDDYRFEVVWSSPNKYLSMLQKATVVVMPDFSVYFNMPFPVQLFQHYKSCWCAKFWQFNGVHVIPNFNLFGVPFLKDMSEPLPHPSIYAVCDIGVSKDSRLQSLFQSVCGEFFSIDDKIIHFTRSKNVSSDFNWTVQLPYRGGLNG